MPDWSSRLIARLEVLRGSRSRWRAGAAVGVACGLALTVGYCNNFRCSSGAWAGSAAFLGGIGGGASALIGSTLRTDRWEEVRGYEIGVSTSSVPRGLGLALTLRW
jgi:hypothetical protein